MKKFAVLCAVLTLVSTAAFAEIVWTGSGRLVFVPFGLRAENSDVANNKAPLATYFGAENPWSGDGPRLGLGVSGKREQGNMGFTINLDLETGTPAIDDNSANVWLKPYAGGGHSRPSRELSASSMLTNFVSSIPVPAHPSIIM
jgi:hypothetical protein